VSRALKRITVKVSVLDFEAFLGFILKRKELLELEFCDWKDIIPSKQVLTVLDLLTTCPKLRKII
jgi:hypothetical protein